MAPSDSLKEGDSMSFFAFKRVAEGYAEYRPYYHPLIMKKIRECTGLDGKFENALDVGCGTGLSTVGLQEIADHVTGADNSPEMIAVAQVKNEDKIPYIHAPAEHLPFKDQSFDILTVCGAINWIDRSQFFPEAGRVLKEKGWAILYDNFITEDMHDNPAYTRWYQEQYLIRYPKPARDESPLTLSECDSHGFHITRDEPYTNDIVFSLDEYIGFIMTQSNISVAIDTGKEDAAGVKMWLHNTLGPLFPEKKGRFIFRGHIWYLQRK
jgi:SAM-dependent methyltransferase